LIKYSFLLMGREKKSIIVNWGGTVGTTFRNITCSRTGFRELSDAKRARLYDYANEGRKEVRGKS